MYTDFRLCNYEPYKLGTFKEDISELRLQATLWRTFDKENNLQIMLASCHFDGASSSLPNLFELQSVHVWLTYIDIIAQQMLIKTEPLWRLTHTMNLLSVKCVEEWNLGETGFGNAIEHQNTIVDKF